MIIDHKGVMGRKTHLNLFLLVCILLSFIFLQSIYCGLGPIRGSFVYEIVLYKSEDNITN